MVARELLNSMKKFLDGVTDAEDFSFEFESELFEKAEQLKEENLRLYDLFHEEMPETCANFEPYEAERLSRPNDYLSEQQMRDKTREVYEKALKLI